MLEIAGALGFTFRAMHILITAGPTHEPLDPVRYLANRSSGKMGYALADAAARAGHVVDLVSGPVALSPPEGVQLHQVTTAVEMLETTLTLLPGIQLSIFAAAVCDYRAASIASEKIKKSGRGLTLDLVENPDILATAAASGTGAKCVGFAAETENVLDQARQKLHRKGCDAIIANDVSRSDAGMGSDFNEVTLILNSGHEITYPLQSKTLLAAKLIAELTRADCFTRSDSR